MKVKVRMAPSPSGNLHIGTARTALFNWLFARKMKGEFVLRIEDTDLERSKPEYERDIIEGFKWLGLDWDGEIYHQSDRLDIYEKYLKQLLDSGKAFWCNHAKEELGAEQKEQMANKEAPRHVCSHRDSKLNSGQIIRFKNSGVDTISFPDLIRGELHQISSLLGDFSLAKDLRTPLYNFAVVVDDIDMEISHVIRGEDHISNTPKQILIYEALRSIQFPISNSQFPIFAHLPLILGPDKSKLSKRNGTVSVNEYKKDYLPEALVNFMGFLGYTYDKEILSMKEMAEEFDIAKVHKSGAIFDVKKLNWINSQYVKQLTVDQFKQLTKLELLSDEAVPLVTERLEKLSDVQDFAYLWQEPKYDRELLKWKKSDLEKSIETLAETKKVVEGFSALGGPASGWDKGKDEFRKVLDEFSGKVGDRGLVYWPLRVALTGKEKSPDPVDIAFVLGKEKTLERVKSALRG